MMKSWRKYKPITYIPSIGEFHFVDYKNIDVEFESLKKELNMSLLNKLKVFCSNFIDNFDSEASCKINLNSTY
jgi:hypothetical protein